MIVAGLILLSVGSADLIRQFMSPPRRWIGLLVAGVLILALGAVGDAILPALLGVALAAAWMWVMPSGRPARAAFWPAVVLGALCGGLVALLGPRVDPGLIGTVWHLPAPPGDVPFDLAVLVIGTIVFLLESANVVVRAALDVEMPARAVPGAPPAPAPAGDETEVIPAVDDALDRDAVPLAVEPALKGGRLIGPLERVIVFAMMLTGAYTLVAAVFAAKGIVRFPEISRDDGTGSRAEYFLIGSMVSWGLALAGALLVWFGTRW